MAGPNASRIRRGRRGECSYCGKHHRKGRKYGDSCKGHNVKALNIPTKKASEIESTVEATNSGPKVRSTRRITPNSNIGRRGRSRVEQRRKEALERDQQRAERSPQQQLAVLKQRGIVECKEITKLNNLINKDKEEIKEKE